jgi:hypothetical protein
MRYEGKLYRPPSEAGSFILQATIGCSWNHCTYCDMYREKSFRVRDLKETLEDIDTAADGMGEHVDKVFVADGDALVLPLEHWLPILERCRRRFPRLERVSCYAMARNVLDKTDEQLGRLREAGLSLLYIGPESGDDVTLKRIAKGQDARRRTSRPPAARSAAGLQALGHRPAGRSGAVERSRRARARDGRSSRPRWTRRSSRRSRSRWSPKTPLATLTGRGRFELPERARAAARAAHPRSTRARADRRGVPHQPRVEPPARSAGRLPTRPREASSRVLDARAVGAHSPAARAPPEGCDDQSRGRGSASPSPYTPRPRADRRAPRTPSRSRSRVVGERPAPSATTWTHDEVRAVPGGLRRRLSRARALSGCDADRLRSALLLPARRSPREHRLRPRRRAHPAVVPRGVRAFGRSPCAGRSRGSARGGVPGAARPLRRRDGRGEARRAVGALARRDPDPPVRHGRVRGGAVRWGARRGPRRLPLFVRRRGVVAGVARRRPFVRRLSGAARLLLQRSGPRHAVRLRLARRARADERSRRPRHRARLRFPPRRSPVGPSSRGRRLGADRGDVGVRPELVERRRAPRGGAAGPRPCGSGAPPRPGRHPHRGRGRAARVVRAVGP